MATYSNHGISLRQCQAFLSRWTEGLSPAVLLSSTLLMILTAFSNAQIGTTAELFEFQLPWDGHSPDFADLSYLNHKPAGAFGFVKVGPDGHLYTADRRIRFLGVNMTYRSAFPTKATAEKIARRLAQLGINIVRFHHLDANWGGEVLFDPAFNDTRHLNPNSLDRLDYFISELKKNGIYTNINLLTARDFRSRDGLDSSVDRMEWKNQQTLAMFDPTMIELQKELASNLLDRVNPYTGLAYREEPALAVVEVLNEHGLMHGWFSGMIDSLPDHYAEQLRKRWNSYLEVRYSNHDALTERWAQSSPDGPQLLRNPGFTSGLINWTVEEHHGALVSESVGQFGPGGKPAVRLEITKTGNQSWSVQFNQGGFEVHAGTVYTLRFWARADRVKEISVNIGMAHDPWQGLGFSKTIRLTPNWQEFEYSLVLPQADTNARVNFGNMADQLASYYFADFSLRQGGSLGIFPDEDLDKKTMRLFYLNESGQRTEEAKHDWFEFLWSLEEAYWTEMRDFLKQELDLKALLTGTVVGTSTPNLMHLFDIIDSHSYWQHPSFVESWGSPWWLTNSSMVDETDGGTVAGLTLKRIQGKPFSVSEYNHSFPNSFRSEAFLFLATYAALQDWDAIYGYTYSDGGVNWTEDRVSGFFDLHRDPSKLITFMHGACIFRRADLSPAEQLVSVPFTKETELEQLPSSSSWRLVDGGYAGIPEQAGLVHRVSMTLGDRELPGNALSPEAASIPDGGPFLSDNGQIRWDPKSGWVQFEGSRSFGFIGSVESESIELNKFHLELTDSLQGWAAVVMSELPNPRQDSGEKHYLLSTHGIVQNSGMVWRYSSSGASAGFPPPRDVELTASPWGSAPVLAEGIGCRITLPFPRTEVEVYALDENGQRKAEVPVDSIEGGSQFETSSSYETLWYEVVVPSERTVFAIPRLNLDRDDFSGIAVSNSSDSDQWIEMTLFDGSGQLEETTQNPVEMNLAARGQFARLGSELFPGSTTEKESGWYSISGERNGIAAFLQTGDFQLTRLDGALAQSLSNPVTESGRLFLTRVCEGEKAFRGADCSTRISFINPSTRPARVLLRLWTRSTLTAEVQLAPLGNYTTTLGELFGSPLEEGYLEIELLEGENVLAVQMLNLGNGQSTFVLNATPATSLSNLYSAQFASIPELLFTSLKLVNTTDETRTLQITASDDRGEILFPPAEVSLDPHGYLEADAGDLFETSSNQSLTRNGDAATEFIGSLEIEVSDSLAGVMGDVVFGLNNLDYAAALPLQSEGFKTAVFSHIANLPGTFFTGLAFFNPNSEPVQIEIEAFNTQGTSVDSALFDLGAGERISDILTRFLPATSEQVGGYLKIVASRPIIAQELFGTTRLTLLSAVPPQTFR